MSELSERLARLSPDQKAMLLARLGRTPKPVRGITAQPHEAIRPLSSTQQRLWFLEQFAPNEPFNVMSGVARVPFIIDADLFIECVQRVTTRHDILRTRFVIDQGSPMAKVDTTVSVPYKVLADLDDDAVWAAFERDARTAFDLSAAPLLRVTIVPRRDHTLVQLTMHHLISDGFSNGVLFNELATEWARLGGSAVRNQLLPFQFADVVAHQQARLGSAEGRAEVDYWVTHLRGAPTRLTLKTTWPRPTRMTYRGARMPFSFAPSLVDRFRSVAAARTVTPFVVVLAGYVAVMSRFAAQDDIVVGIPVAGRDEPGTEALVGPFLNTLAMRFDLSGNPTFAAFVDSVGSIVNDGLRHQDAPFEEVLRALAVPRDPSRSPVFQTVFNYQFAQTGGTDGFQLRDVHNGSAQCDIRLDLISEGQHLAGHVDYASDIYDAQAIETILDGVTAFLDAATADPDRRIRSLPLVDSGREREAIAAATARLRDKPVDSDATIHSMILDQCRRTPTRTAILTDALHLNYAQLDAESAVLAQQLHGQIAAPAGARIGLLLPRSPHTPIAMLAVLRAGWSYVPLDPDYPRERLSFICQDAGIVGLVTLKSHADTATAILGPDARVPVVSIDTAAPTALATPPPAEVPGAASHEAYTIYTSGSTGLPKGVQISHTSVVNFLCSMRDEPGIAADDVLLAVTSPSFDIAVLEMLLPLTVGAAVVVASREDANDGQRMQALLGSHHVTIMQATPTTWQILLTSGWAGDPRLTALCGGEVLASALAANLRDRVFSLWNMYGPTEATIWSTAHHVSARDTEGGTIPIGSPIRRTAAIVVDDDLRPVPAGVLGELCLGGDGVAIGYLDRPQTTAEQFVRPDWFDRQRLYRTGDLVLARADGVLEYTARMDTQVKLRGHRIELAEIENALDRHGAVDRAVAVIRDTEQGGELLAYVEAGQAGGEQLDLREWLANQLPGYMVPSRVVWLERLPLTANGKIDRNALPEPAPTASQPGADHATPVIPAATDTQRTVITVWQELLARDDFGIDEGFFKLGGHSLLATKLVFRIREVTGIELPLQVLFEGEPTVRRISELLDHGPDAVTVRPEELDLAAEAVLSPEIHPEPSALVHSVRSPQHPLVTGGTGFMGSFLLAELLRTTDAVPFCHVRAASESEGLARLREAMVQYDIWDAAYADRIIPVLGDLRRDRIGLSTPMWDHLSETVDSIYHCGAEVNFLSPYAALKPANVEGTRTILRLAVNRTTKPVHFVSTTYVFSRFAYPANTAFTEDMDPIHDLTHTFGYTQSKWVSEQMVSEAGRRGLPTYIYRAGRIAGHSRTGACQTYDFVWQAVKAAVEMGASPDINMQVDVTPVDYAVAALVRIARQPGQAGKAFHLVAPEPIDEPTLVQWMLDRGYVGERMSFDNWCALMVDRAAQLSDRTAGALAPFFSGILPLDKMPPASFRADNAEAALAGSGITCPPITRELIDLYLDYFVDVGFLPSTTEQSRALERMETA